MSQTTNSSRELAPIPQGVRSTGSRRSRRPQQPWEAEEFRILSIDGGGIRGILPATILDLCERHFLRGESAGDYFDMIAGTSTGGIIALGLGKGETAGDILKLYTDHGEEIFPPEPERKGVQKVVGDWWKFGRNVSGVRYDAQALTRQLERTFGSQLYGESKRRLVIPTFDAHTKVNVLKTPHHGDFQIDWQKRMVDVALATSAAPTYLPPHRIGTQVYADGGVWANNPVMLALVDALTCYDLDRHKVRILSLGCGSGELRMSEKQISRGGQWDWRDIVNVAMELSSQNADGQAKLLVGPERFCRLDIPDQVHPIPLDDVKTAKAILPGEGKRLFDEGREELASFFDNPRPTYPAFYGPRKSS
ncbi:CBASS cGAMP-activated phospholipase [Jiella endophytica]|uniref:CBASS cGAMP-activated phospholipase n=1 Tax=Jiella endophytica TaxID=2558362 RepID=UPI00142F6FFC|nr:CBASS cGAMP-activated phospholipase [Jiella endophytica]